MPDSELSDFIAFSITRLKSADIESADLDARLLIAHDLKLDRAQLLSQSARVLDSNESQRLTILIDRRARREPVARIIGHREFWGLPFTLNEATLEPRPESETLVEAALAHIKQRHSGENGHPDNLKILDLGTGTGCLLLSLLHELPNAAGLGVDVVSRAVEQAAINAKNLKLDHRAKFQTGNWLDSIYEKFDIIISNPPYIPQRDIFTLMPEVRDYDPKLALDGGADGLDVYRRLIPQLPRFLNASGFIAFEVGQHQAPSVADIFRQSAFAEISVHKDLGSIERCVVAYEAGSPPSRE